MGLFSALFGGSGATLSLEEFVARAEELHKKGQHQAAVNLSNEYRIASDRDRRINQQQRLYQNGVGYVVILKPLAAIAKSKRGLEAHQALVAYYCAHIAGVYYCLQDLTVEAGFPQAVEAQRWRKQAWETEETLKERFHEDDLEAADQEANEIIAKGIRGAR